MCFAYCYFSWMFDRHCKYVQTLCTHLLNLSFRPVCTNLNALFSEVRDIFETNCPHLSQVPLKFKSTAFIVKPVCVPGSVPQYWETFTAHRRDSTVKQVGLVIVTSSLVWGFVNTSVSRLSRQEEVSSRFTKFS